MAYTIDKQVFPRNFSIHYTYYTLKRGFDDVALPVTTTCTLSDSYANLDEFDSPLL